MWINVRSDILCEIEICADIGRIGKTTYFWAIVQVLTKKYKRNKMSEKMKYKGNLSTKLQKWSNTALAAFLHLTDNMP